MKKRDKILQAAKARLVDTFGDKIKDVILFGSRAWGKPKRWSDYDILVVVRGDCDWHTITNIRRTLYALDSDYDVLIQTLVISEYELDHTVWGQQSIYQDAVRLGIHA